MSKLVQIKNVPDAVHRTLKARAAHAGMTLSDYVRKELMDIAARPTLEEVLERIQKRGPVGEPFDAAAAVRAERDSR